MSSTKTSPALIFITFFWCTCIMWSGCAPQLPTPEDPVEETGNEATQAPRPEPTTVSEPLPTQTPEPTPVPEIPITKQQNPDWEARYQELYAQYATQFEAPEIPAEASLQLKNGNEMSGTIETLTETEVTLAIANGSVTYNMASLSDQTAETYFQAAFARNRALKQGRQEFKQWKSEQENPSPAPQQQPDSEPKTVRVGKPPVNEGSVGRVWQVDEYIRKNAAVPHSLRVKAWGKVQPHKKGYKVRVQYSLKSAEDFGISHEDMMFFMNSNGRVYQKAAVK